MAFDFNLQKVLDVRNIEEDIAQNRFLQARKEKKRLENRLQEMNQKQQNIYDYLRSDARDSVEKTLQARQFLQINRQRIENQQEKVTSQKQVVDERQQEMIDKQKKRKVLERLKEKKFDQFKNDFILDQQKKLDDLGQRLIRGERD